MSEIVGASGGRASARASGSIAARWLAIIAIRSRTSSRLAPGVGMIRAAVRSAMASRRAGSTTGLVRSSSAGLAAASPETWASRSAPLRVRPCSNRSRGSHSLGVVVAPVRQLVSERSTSAMSARGSPNIGGAAVRR